MAGRCECQRPCTCCTTGSASIAVGGSGSAGDCVVPEVTYSGDAGNRSRAGIDGGVYSDLCAVTPAGVAATINEDGCLELPPACIVDSGGNPLVPNIDGCVQLPAAATPEYGCGLSASPEGILSVAGSGAWPLDALDGLTLEGGPEQGSDIYCDPVTGQLRGAPEHTSVGVSSDQTLQPTTIISVPTSWTSPASTVVQLTNPSLSRRMTLRRYLRVTVDLQSGAAGGALVNLEASTNGGAWTTLRQGRWPESPAATLRASLQISQDSTSIIVPPGGTHSVRVRATVNDTGTGDNAVIAVSAGIALLGVTR